MGSGALYTICFVLGLSVVGASWLLGHHGGHGHAQGSHGHDSLPLFSPTVLAVFVGMFGAGGLFCRDVLHLGFPWHLVGALASSGVSGLSVAYTMMKLLEHGETNSVSRFEEVVGRDVEVIVAMRGPDVGEVAFEAAGTRQTALARSASGDALPAGARVRVARLVDGVLEVRPSAGELEAAARGTPVRDR
jgi:membrane protein implicated in regulation of membrane protease activity